MSVKVFIINSAVSNEVRKKQHVQDILSALKIPYDVVDVLDPRNDEQLKFMHCNAKPKKPNQKPVFNGDDYCGDYSKFVESLEWDQLYEFLKLENPNKTSKASVITGEDEEEHRKN
ncbi:SH3 domain-binding glutamic acid-rich-like protein 2 [Physella acuta]|uniref:SH3 domain-binding glutamic acid-rich-like protein 2 n=1 Tax=Physella acuta TaxID=109671 RepID=UPI0027DD5F7A|nr:SH3 domain-binding glutamic acid-rich-like protein 2 [Physella acuta]